MQHWDLGAIEVVPHQPQVLSSDGEGRSIVLSLPAGDMLQEHQVHERAWLLVLDGELEIAGNPETIRGGRGLLAVFEPKERHEVRAVSDSRLLLLLAPWPGEGRPAGG